MHHPHKGNGDVYICLDLLSMFCLNKASVCIAFTVCPPWDRWRRMTSPCRSKPAGNTACAQCAGYLPSPVVRASYSSRGNLFRDVFPGQWYYEDIDRAMSAGYINGVGRNYYDPTGGLQRGQLLVLLYRYSGEAVEPDAAAALPFTDVPKDAYYAGAVAWAYGKGIAGGSDSGAFEPLHTETRQEMSKIFFDYLCTLDTALPDGTGSADQYADWDEIAPWAREAVERLTAIGLLSGEGDGRFHPAEEFSRAQAAVMLMRLADFLTIGR